MKVVTIINGIEIRERKRENRKKSAVPKYGAYAADGRHLKDFKRLVHAKVWVTASKDL